MLDHMKINSHLLKLISVTLLSLILTMASSFVLARFLSVEERGLHQLFITSVSYAVTVSTGGVGFALAICMRHKQYRNWRSYLISFLIFSVILSGIGLCIFNITSFYFLFITNVFFTAILTITLDKSKIDPKLNAYRMLMLQQPILLVSIYGISYLILGEQKLEIVLYLFTLFSVIQALFCLFYLYKIEDNFKNTEEIKNIDRKFFIGTWIKQNLLQTFGATTASLDKFMIMYFLGNYTLGLYTVCIAFDSLVTKFINMLADYYYSGLLNNLNRIKSVLIIVALMSIGAIILVPLLAEPIVIFFFSHKYAEVSSVLLWFIVNAILSGLSWILSQNMLIKGKQVLLLTRQIIAISVFILLFYFLQQYQLYGIAYALIGSSLTKLAISIFYYFKYPIKI